MKIYELKQKDPKMSKDTKYCWTLNSVSTQFLKKYNRLFETIKFVSKTLNWQKECNYQFLHF